MDMDMVGIEIPHEALLFFLFHFSLHDDLFSIMALTFLYVAHTDQPIAAVLKGCAHIDPKLFILFQS